jgi:hypothetical protein
LRLSIDRELRLFDLSNDPREENDLAAAYPELVQQLKRAYLSWREDVLVDAPFDEREFIELLESEGLTRYRGLLLD